MASVEYSPDGWFLTTRDESRDFRVWEATTGRLVIPTAPDRRFPPFRPYLHGFSRDGTSLTAVDEDLTVRIWKMPEVRPLRTFKVGTADTLRFWHHVLTHSQRIDFYSGVTGCRLALGAGNRLLALAREDKHVHVWDLDEGKLLCRLPHAPAKSSTLMFAPDGRALLTLDADWTLRLWRLPGGAPLAKLRAEKEERAYFKFSQDSRWLAWGWGQTIRLWDLTRGREMCRLHNPEWELWKIAFEADGPTLVLRGADGTVRLWDVATGKKRRRLTSAIPDNPYTGLVLLKGTEDLALSPDARVLAVDTPIPLLLETATGSEIFRLPAGHRGDVTALAFAPNGRTLATGGADSTVLVWDWQRLAGLTGGDGAKREPQALWADLAAKDASVAYRAIGALAADPGRAVAFLAKQVRPVRTEDGEPIRRLLKDLEDKRFVTRQRAERELAKLGAEWAPLLEESLGAEPALEARRRIEGLLDAPALRHWSPAMVRQLRALHALERIGTPEARRLLKRVADGLPEARLTQEAKAALRRVQGHEGKLSR